MSQNDAHKLNEFVRRLLDFEVAAGKSADAEAALRVFSKLSRPLGKVMGLGGFRALLSRALSLASADFPWLRELSINEDSSLEGFAALKETLDSDAITEGGVALVAAFLGLLATFIGPALTLRLLHDIWPAMDDFKF